MAVLVANLSLAGIPSADLPPVETEMMVQGPFNDDPDHIQATHLDLAGRAAALRLVPGGALFFERMVGGW